MCWRNTPSAVTASARINPGRLNLKCCRATDYATLCWMFSEVSAHDRARAWRALSRRARSSYMWYQPAVEAAILATVQTGRFDSVLVEDLIAEWNTCARELPEAVVADLGGRWPGHDQIIKEYVGLNLYDWLRLPSAGAMEAFVRGSLELRDKWGLRRDLFDQQPHAETFHPQRQGVPRVVLRAVDGGGHFSVIGDFRRDGPIMVDFVDFWPHQPGYTTVSAITDSVWRLIVLDVRAREDGFIATALLNDVAKLCRLWGGLLSEYRGWVYPAAMNIAHMGIAEFPGR